MRKVMMTEGETSEYYSSTGVSNAKMGTQSDEEKQS